MNSVVLGLLKFRKKFIKKCKIEENCTINYPDFVYHFLVLMMSRPVTKAFLPGWLSARQDSRLVVILDNSASMSAKNYDRSNLEISKNLVMTIMPLFEKKPK